MTEVPSISVSDNPTTSPSTSMMPTVAPKLVYFPAKFGTLVYCMHGDLSDPHVLSTMPPANDEMYATMCDCCSAKVGLYECHSNYKAECPTNKPTSSIITSRPTTSMPLVPFSSPILPKPTSSRPSTLKPTSTIKPTVTSVIPFIHHCDVVVGDVGDAYWYPHDDDDEERGCAMDDEYPVGFYDNDALCHSFLFTSVDDCCLKFPDSCNVSVSTDVIEAMWYPEVFTSSSSNIKLLECIPGSDYPAYMTLPKNADTHLFDTEDDCCIHIPCGKKLSNYWYPVADVTAETVVCKFDNDYPIYMLVDSTEKKRLFTNETECVASWGAALHHCDADDGQGQAYWYPHDEDEQGCALDADYPAELYTDNALCTSFLFKTLDER